MVGDVPGHLVQIVLVGRPGLGNVLAGRVGEEVAVVEVHHHGKTGLVSPGSQAHDVVLPAPATFGIHPDAETYRIDSHLFQHVHDIGLRAILPLE